MESESDWMRRASELITPWAAMPAYALPRRQLHGWHVCVWSVWANVYVMRIGELDAIFISKSQCRGWHLTGWGVPVRQ